jgi:hypothetical protein
MFDFALFQVASLRLGYIGVKRKNLFDLAYQLCFFLKRLVAFVFQAHSETVDGFCFCKVCSFLCFNSDDVCFSESGASTSSS